MAIEQLRNIGGVIYIDRGDGRLVPVSQGQLDGSGPATPPRADVPMSVSEPRNRSMGQRMAGLLGDTPNMLNGTGIPERLAVANEFFNPVAGIYDSMDASQQMLAPNRTGYERATSLAEMLTGLAGAGLAGADLARGGVAGAAAVADSLFAGTPAARSMADTADLTAREALAYARSVGEGDLAFLRGGGVPQSLSSANTGGIYNALARVPQSAIDNATPVTRRGSDEFVAPRTGGSRSKDMALYSPYSKIKQGVVAPYDWEMTGRKLAGLDTPPVATTPTDMRSQFDYLYGYPADSTMLNTVVDSVNGQQLPQGILQQAGQSFPDAQFGFASELKALEPKLKVFRNAKEAGERIAVTPMSMGAESGDFSRHVGATFGQMIAANADNIDPKFTPSYPAPLMKKLKGNVVGLLDPRFPYWLESLSGTNQAAVLKALDKSDALAAGVPSVGAARWATMNPELAGAELLSSGYRVFEPYPVARTHGGELHSSYNAVFDKVGPSMTMGDTRPMSIMFPDEAYPRLVASTKAGRNILEDKAKPKDLRAFQMNPKLRQKIDNQWEDANSMYDEILKSRGKTAADMYALEAMMNRASMRAR